jgi:hypothetical protein
VHNVVIITADLSVRVDIVRLSRRFGYGLDKGKKIKFWKGTSIRYLPLARLEV